MVWLGRRELRRSDLRRELAEVYEVPHGRSIESILKVLALRSLAPAEQRMLLARRAMGPGLKAKARPLLRL